MDPLQQLRRLHEQRTKRTFVRPPDEIHPALSLGMPAVPPAHPAKPLPSKDRRAARHLEELVPGAVIETEIGECYVATTAWPAEQMFGPLALGTLLEHEPARLAPLVPGMRAELLAPGAFSASAVLDIETTGLGGGAGTYAFMVGVGLFEPQTRPDGTQGLDFVVHQLFMRSPAEEPALLVALHHLLEGRELLLSFNGRSFDAPVLRTRYAVNRRFLPEAARAPALLAHDAPHIDLLIPARKLWRRRLQSCRLINLETHLLGRARSEEDVPGFLIPELYVAFLRTGRADEMRRIFYHNAEDIVSTAAIAGQVCHTLGNPAARPALDGRDLLSLGASLEKMQRWDEALTAYEHAIAALQNAATQRDAFSMAAALCKRTGRWDEAVRYWEQWLTTVPDNDATPYIELAKYYEWQVHDPGQALSWAAFGLHTVQALPQRQQLPGQAGDLERRTARLQRKIAPG